VIIGSIMSDRCLVDMDVIIHAIQVKNIIQDQRMIKGLEFVKNMNETGVMIIHVVKMNVQILRVIQVHETERDEIINLRRVIIFVLIVIILLNIWLVDLMDYLQKVWKIVLLIMINFWLVLVGISCMFLMGIQLYEHVCIVLFELGIQNLLHVNNETK